MKFRFMGVIGAALCVAVLATSVAAGVAEAQGAHNPRRKAAVVAQTTDTGEAAFRVGSPRPAQPASIPDERREPLIVRDLTMKEAPVRIENTTVKEPAKSGVCPYVAVSGVADGATHSLRWAIEQANLDASCSAVQVEPGNHEISLPTAIPVTSPLSLNANPVDPPTISNPAVGFSRRTLDVSASLRISGLHFVGGQAYSGGIIAAECEQDCELRVAKTRFDGGTASGPNGGGGAIWAGYAVSVVAEQSHFEGNLGSYLGAAIYASHNVTIEQSSFVANNSAPETSVWGTALYASGGNNDEVRILDSDFSHHRGANTVHIGVVLGEAGLTTVTLERLRFIDNTHLESMLPSDIWRTAPLRVGGHQAGEYEMSARDLEFRDNTTAGATVVAQETSGTWEGLSIIGNASPRKVDLWPGLVPSTNNTIANSTIVDASSSERTMNVGPGSKLLLDHVTVRSANARVLSAVVTSLGIEVAVENSYLSSENATVCQGSSGLPTFENSYVTDDSCGIDASGPALTFVQPVYAGGFGRSIAPVAGSPLIDAVDIADCATSAFSDTDQRGTPRPVNNKCDIGAVEVLHNDLCQPPAGIDAWYC